LRRWAQFDVGKNVECFPRQGPLGAVEKVRVFVDDAHGIGWTGSNGKGLWLAAAGTLPRVVVAVSLCKAVSAGAGGLLFATEEERRFARIAGIANYMTAPPQPDTLAMICCFFKFTRTEAFTSLCSNLDRLMTLFNVKMAGHPKYT